MPTRTIPARRLGAIPLPEVSGLARGRDSAGRDAILAIGDRAGTVAWAVLVADLEELSWQTLDLRHAQGTGIPDLDPQLEAVAVDGRMSVVLVQESPNRAEVIDAPSRRVRAHISFVVPDVAALLEIRTSWLDTAGSHTEGVVLMREGHILLVKEKDPPALLEFGPAGSEPLGLVPAAWLPHDQGWTVAEGEVELTCLAAWRPGDHLQAECPDFSDAAVDAAGRLLLTGDQAAALVRIGAHPPAEDPFAGRVEAEAVWLVQGIEEKPEGVVVLPGGDVLIACDRRKAKRNLFLVAGDDLA